MQSVVEPLPWLYVPAMILLPPLLVVLMRNFLHGHGPAHRKADQSFLTLFFLFATVFVFMFSFFNSFIRSRHDLESLIPSGLSPILLVWSGLNLGATLYILRQARLQLYGVVEVLVAVTALTVTAYSMTPDTFATTTIGFVGSVYVFVRGFTNYVEGRDKRR